MVRLVLWTVIAAALGCGKSSEPKTGGGRGANTLPANQAGDGAHEASSSQWLVLQQHDPTSDRVRYLPVAIAGDTPAPSKPIDGEALARPNWKDHYITIASAAGDHLYTAATTAGRWELRERKLDDPDARPRVIPIAVDRISALLAIDSRVVVGAGMKVGWVDTGADKPAFSQLAEHPGAYKAYDLFARDGDLIAAIDDEVGPIYGELLHITDNGVEHLEGWDMPSFINGTYEHAVLAMSDAGARDGVLYAMGSYGIMSGNGHDLTALPIRGGKLPAGLAEVLNSGGAGTTNPPVIEEHVDRGSGKVERVAHGSEMTPWTGLALTRANQVAVAAGKRGLLWFPGEFSPTTKANALDVGGSCHDVIAVGSALYVLIESGGKGQLGIVDVTGEGPEVAKRVDLPAAYQRFVR